MKMMKRVFSLLLFFVAAMSVQTVQAQTNGDVNGDGKVNEQDIAAILEIMAEAGGVKEQTKYYWYVGQDLADNLITTDNYKDYCQSVTNYQSSQTFTVNRKYLYLVVLASKTVEALDSSKGPLNFKYYNNTAKAFRNAQTTVTLDDGNEYIIYRSAATANDKYTITIK